VDRRAYLRVLFVYLLRFLGAVEIDLGLGLWSGARFGRRNFGGRSGRRSTRLRYRRTRDDVAIDLRENFLRGGDLFELVERRRLDDGRGADRGDRRRRQRARGIRRRVVVLHAEL